MTLQIFDREGHQRVSDGPWVVSADNSSTTPLAADATFTGAAEDVLRFRTISISLYFEPNEIPNGDGSTAQGSFWFEFSDDAVNWDVAVPSFVRSGIFIPYLLVVVKRYFRVRYENDGGVSAIAALGLNESAGTPTLQTTFRLTTLYSKGASNALGRTIDQGISGSDPVTLTRGVSVGKTPNESFKNRRVGGRHNANSTTSLLGASAVWRGTWIEWQGRWVGMVTDLASDAEGTLFLDFTEDESPVDGDESSVQDSLSVNYDPAVTPILRRITPIQSRWVRARYTNGDTAQTAFSLDTALITEAPPLVMQRLGENIEHNNLAGIIKSVVSAPDAIGEYRVIGRGGLGEGLTTVVTQVLQEVQSEPNNRFETGQLNVGSVSPSQIAAPTSLTRVRSLQITNNDGVDTLFFREQSASVLTAGAVIPPGATRELSYGTHEGDLASTVLRPWLQASGTSVFNTLNIDADTEDTNVGVTPVDAMFADDSTRAIFDSVADLVTVSGFDASTAITQTTIASVKIKMQARKEAGATGELSLFNAAVIVDAGNVTSIQSPTVTAGPSLFYLVFVARRSTGAAVTSITNTMGFSGSVLIEDFSNGSESRITCYRMTGVPTGDGTITANFSSTADHCVISVVSVDNVDLTDPVVDSDETGAATGTSISGTVTALENGLVVQGIATEQITVVTHQPTFVERAEDGSTSNNDQMLNIATAPVLADGTVTWGATVLSASGDNTGIAVSLRPVDALDPIMRVIHSEGTTFLQVAVDALTDTDYEQDITGDAAWTEALLDGLTLTISPTVISNADCEVDRLWIEVQEAGGAINAPYVWYGDD